MQANCLTFWKCSNPRCMPGSVSTPIDSWFTSINIAPVKIAPSVTLRLQTYRFEVTVVEACCRHTSVGFFRVPSLGIGVGQTVLPVVDLFFFFGGKIYTMTDAVEQPSVVFIDNTFLGLKFFTPDFSMVEGADSADEACFVYDLNPGEGSGDIRYFSLDVNPQFSVAQGQN